ncbi:putative membrane protein YhiD involved in acid resistance [Haloferula luteola]|uniref:Putative membrane protein YhiD involved in acid resistance n=1 Tax=Haloferula luteola TaxID=595692 RepID=A0A840V411_9BACT|nr:DUF4956 domain-containing protein [Haloferula luteola]MBB5353037.1 putative membrane protein YhiD involved in acid resistance [Haloferula luteola]
MNLANLFHDVFQPGIQDHPGPLEIALAMVYSLALNLAIACIYRLTYKGTRYSQDYVQTLIMIGVVTTILIMVVSGNGAIAFGMFAAFSVIRFRRTLGQSRDLAFVFFAMAIGMVVGARQYGMAAIILVIVGVAIYVLSVTDAFAPRRASHQLTMRLTNDMDFEKLLAPIFEKFAERAQLVRVSSAQAGMMTELRYGLQLKEKVSTAEFLEALQLASGNNRVVLTPTSVEFDA